MPSRILLAPNSMKGSLDAGQVANAMEQGVRKVVPNAEVVKMPVADGGDAFLDIMHSIHQGVLVETKVEDPLGKKITTSFSRSQDGSTAFIELAKASGLNLLKKHEYDPLKTSTYGTGQLMVKAMEIGCSKIILGVGGSATVDAGCGILQALGIRLLDVNNREIAKGGGHLSSIYNIDNSGSNPSLNKTGIVIACDVENVLTGTQGAACVFGPQKGSRKQDVNILEKGLEHFAKITLEQTRKEIANLKYGGAAGGVPAGLYAWLNAELVPGSKLVLQEYNFEEMLENTGLVFTAEGKLDSQSLQGKAPYEVAKKCKEENVPVVCICGMLDENCPTELFDFFEAVLPLTDKQITQDVAMVNAGKLISEKIGQYLKGRDMILYSD